MEFDTPANTIGYYVNKANAALRGKFKRDLKAFGFDLTPEQWGALNFLLSSPGSSLTEMAELAFRDKTSMSRLIDGLTKKKLVQRSVDPQDRRTCRLHLTEEGEKLCCATRPAAELFNNELRGLLTDEESALLVHCLSMIVKKIDTSMK